MKNKNVLFALLFLCFIDALGMTIILPILPNIFYDHNYGLLVNYSSSSALLYGLSIAIFPLGTLLGMPILGTYSDKFGEKKALLAGLKIEVLGFVIAVVSIYIQTPFLFIISRAICGFAIGNYAVINSTIVKNVKEIDRSLVFRYPILAFLLGGIIGPILGGTCLSVSNSRWALMLPFLIAIILALINFVMLHLSLKDIKKELVKDESRKVFQAFKNLFFIFSKKELLSFVMFLLLLRCMQGVFTQSIAVVLSQSLDFSTSKITLFFTLSALFTIISIMYVQIKVTKLIKSLNKRVLICVIIIFFTFILLYLFVENNLMLWSMSMLVYLILPILNTNCFAYISLQIPDDEQGKAFGGIGQIQYVGFMIGGLSIVVFNISTTLVTVIPLIFTLLALVLFLIKK